MACREEAGKRELLRFVRDPLTLEVAIDPDARAPGRGAYLHRTAACLELARRRGSLSRALKAEVPEGIWAALA